jgi:hypothetical protein
MPGPNSAPNGDRSLVYGWVTVERNHPLVGTYFVRLRKRDHLRNRGRLYTGKTEGKK